MIIDFEVLSRLEFKNKTIYRRLAYHYSSAVFLQASSTMIEAKLKKWECRQGLSSIWLRTGFCACDLCLDCCQQSYPIAARDKRGVHLEQVGCHSRGTGRHL